MVAHDCDTPRDAHLVFGQVGLRPLVAIAPSLPVIAYGESRSARRAEARHFLRCFVVLCTTFAEGEARGGSSRSDEGDGSPHLTGTKSASANGRELCTLI